MQALSGDQFESKEGHEIFNLRERDTKIYSLPVGQNTLETLFLKDKSFRFKDRSLHNKYNFKKRQDKKKPRGNILTLNDRFIFAYE